MSRGAALAVKGSHLKELLLQDGPCEEKLEKIHALLGIPYERTGADGGTETGPFEPEPANAETERDASIARIVDGLQNTELRLANEILTAIEQSSLLSWDNESLEIKIRGEAVAHTNLGELIKKIVRLQTPILPYGLALFIYNLLEIKCPISVYRDGDSINLRKNLILIRKNYTDNDTAQTFGNLDDTSDTQSETEAVASESVQKSSAEPIIEQSSSNVEPKINKRKRGIDLEDQPVEIGVTGGVRRSKRLKLKQPIEDGWAGLGKQ